MADDVVLNRRWVRTLPQRLRYALASDPPLFRAVLAVFGAARGGIERGPGEVEHPARRDRPARA